MAIALPERIMVGSLMAQPSPLSAPCAANALQATRDASRRPSRRVSIANGEDPLSDVMRFARPSL